MTRAGWIDTTLGEVAEIISGATPKTSVSEYWDGGIPWVTPKDLSELDGMFIGKTPRTLSDLGLKSCGASLLPANSVLLSSRAPIGHVAINTVPVATNQGFKSLVPDPSRMEAKFLYWWLRCNRQRIEAMGNGATFKEISKKITASISVSLPSLEEQKRIASILDTADELRTKRQQAIDQLDTLTNAVAVAEFVGLIDYDTLGDHLDFVTSGSRGWAKFYAESGSRFVRSQDVRLGSISEDNPAFVQAPDNAEAERTVVRQGDLLVTITGIVGRVAAVSSELDGAFVSQHVSIARPSPSLRPAFAEAFMCSSAGQYQLERAQYGQTTPGLNLTQIREFRLPVPSLSEQDRVLEKLDLLHHKAEALRRSASSCATLFGSLQQRAFRGDL